LVGGIDATACRCDLADGHYSNDCHRELVVGKAQIPKQESGARRVCSTTIILSVEISIGRCHKLSKKLIHDAEGRTIGTIIVDLSDGM
jgi:hypothetical protein